MLTIRRVFLIATCGLAIGGCGDTYAQKPVTNDTPQVAKTVTPEGQISKTLSKSDLELCFDILDGSVAVSGLPLQDPGRNSFYLDCSLGIFIGTVKANNADHERARAAQIQNAAFLFTQDIKSQYKGRYGDSLISIVIGSQLSTDDKLAWVKRLVDEGADINSMNEYGNEALRAAEFSKQQKIYDWLVANGARSKPANTPQ